MPAASVNCYTRIRLACNEVGASEEVHNKLISQAKANLHICWDMDVSWWVTQALRKIDGPAKKG